MSDEPLASGLKLRRAAILASDVAGYSRLMAADNTGTVASLDAVRAVFRGSISSYRGELIDTAGDSVLAVFESPSGAVRAALQVQTELARRNEAITDERRMRCRIGVHEGDILQKDDRTVYGDGVNIAARLQSLAEPGGLTISVRVADAVRGDVDAHFVDQGEQIVKNIPYPVHACRWATADGQSPAGAIAHAVPTTNHPSLAVLPFANLSDEPDREYFADGITEDLTAALSRLRWLNVTARNSAFAYKERTQDVREIGKALAVRYVVEGSVRKSADRVRISCHLVEAATGNEIWAERYDRALAQTFELQDEITLTIAGAVGPELSKAEQNRVLRRSPVESMDAWDQFQRGLWHFWQYTREAHAEARRLFQSAIARDPRFAPAHSHLALSYFSSFVNGFDDSPESFPHAVEAANRALALDDKEAVARFVLGRVYTQMGHYTAAIEELRGAVNLNPSFAQAHYGLGVALLGISCWDEALEAGTTAERLSPHDPMMHAFLALRASALACDRRLQEAELVARRGVRHRTASLWNLAALASILGHLERTEEAREVLGKLLAMRPDFSEELVLRFFAMPRDAPATDASRPNLWEYYFTGLYKAGMPRRLPAASVS